MTAKSPLFNQPDGGSGPNAGQSTKRLTQDIVDEVHDFVLSGGETRTATGRFTKGTSGNPRGRPKRDMPDAITPPATLDPESLSAIALRYGARKIKARTEDGEVEITLTEAAFSKTAREAVKGNTGHSRTFHQTVARAEAEKAKLKREAFRHWAAVKEQATELYLEAERTGEEPPLSVHPDDIILNPDGTVEIVGPTERGDIAVMRYVHSKVNYHLVNIGYWQWIERRWVRKRGKESSGCPYAVLDFYVEQNELPPRLRLSTNEVDQRLRSYSRLSGRALHRLLRQAAEPFEGYVPPRETRVLITVPTTVLDFAVKHGIGGRKLLDLWPDAMVTALEMQTGRATQPVASDAS